MGKLTNNVQTFSMSTPPPPNGQSHMHASLQDRNPKYFCIAL